MGRRRPQRLRLLGADLVRLQGGRASALPRTSRAQSTVGAPVARANLQPGDLVFFYRPVGHVGIYIGNGQMVHAPTSGSVVKVTNMNYMPFSSARRVA